MESVFLYGFLYFMLTYFGIGLAFGIYMFFTTLNDPKFGGGSSYTGPIFAGLMFGLSWPVWVWGFWGLK